MKVLDKKDNLFIVLELIQFVAIAFIHQLLTHFKRAK